jgi:DNA-binding MarR family transcriptional regulator
MEKTLNEVSPSPLALSQFRLLLLIDRPARSFMVSDVAEIMGVTNAAASRSTDRLVQRGLIDRRVSSEDRRAVELTLTEEGEALLERVRDVSDKHLFAALGDYDDEKLEELSKLLDELAVRLLNMDEARTQKCLRCGVHFREGCIMREVLGRSCIFSERLYGSREPIPGSRVQA